MANGSYWEAPNERIRACPPDFLYYFHFFKPILTSRRREKEKTQHAGIENSETLVLRMFVL